MDRINIKNLEIFANHGLFPEENTLGQKFVISAELFTDLRGAGESDDLSLSLDYGGICGTIKSFVEDNTFKLVETVAERLAEKLLVENPRLQSIRLEIKKPWAPVAMHLDTVSVEIERSRHTAYIALGANIGDREANLRFAVDELGKSRGCRVLQVSNFINTAPYGYLEQDDFLNGCLELETLLTPSQLLKLLHKIEDKAGRVRKAHWGPRTLDLDIIFYDDAVVSDNTLRIPHAEMHKRDFVLIPLNEIAPNMLHPVLKKTVSELLEG
jgi:dihydroneopterin aldolase/2-amino-4-hydroxy-6-hydroxymethyldihydropteridine diphosphokinase